MAEKKTETKKNTQQKDLNAYYNERIQVVFPKPADVPYGSTRTVVHNGVNYQIQYDVPVMVPRKVALIVKESLKNQREMEKRMVEKAENNEFLGEF